MNIFERIGVSPVINAAGAVTRLSGGIMAEEVAEAMAEATHYCVDMAELQGAASEALAAATGAEAGYVTSGAAAGLLLGAAACMTGLNPGRMARLPVTVGMKHEVVMVRSQRNFYDHAVRTTGAAIVEVGLPDRYAGAGVRDAEAWEIADAIGEKTACILYVADRRARPSLPEVVRVAHAAGVPVVVDAAAQLPPAANLRRFIAEGADLVAFSGGKAIGGPQATGLLCGRRDLIMAAALQQLDLDVLADYWSPPSALVDVTLLRGIPPHGIGRPCKVGKEGIIGLLKALEVFLGEGDVARHARWLAVVRLIRDGLKGIPGARVEIYGEDDVETVPRLALALQPSARLSADELILRLQKARPSIYANPEAIEQNIVLFNPICLRPGEAEKIVEAVRAHSDKAA
jgi:L-seryl-tRNA(Ser) seleniumtransferase